MKPTLIFTHRDAVWVKALQSGFQSNPQLVARVATVLELRKAKDLDALFLTVMAAERWGARPIIHQAQILRTTPTEQENNWPPFIIAGVALKKGEDPWDVRYGLTVIIIAVLEAVSRFNLVKGVSIRTIGFDSDWLGIQTLPPAEAAQLICRAYDEAIIDADSVR